MFKLSKDQLIQIFKKMVQNKGIQKYKQGQRTSYKDGYKTSSGLVLSRIFRQPIYKGRDFVGYRYNISLTNSRSEIYLNEEECLTKSEYELLEKQFCITRSKL